MSREEWEHGVIKLPTAEFSRVRQAIADDDLKRQTEVFEHTQTFWKSLNRKQRTDRREYLDAAQEYAVAEEDRIEKENRRIAQRTSWSRAPQFLPDNSDAILRELQETLHRGNGKPRRVLKSDIEFPTNKTLTFGDDNADVVFNREESTVTWSVGGNNHAVDFARGGALAHKFFETMNTVKWTRGTGGIIHGNDEYNDGPHGEGRGSDYATSGFGPIGAAGAPHATAKYRTATGDLVDPLNAMQDRRRNGQFDFKRGAPPEITLR